MLRLILLVVASLAMGFAHAEVAGAQTAPDATISGSVFLDTNGNGLLDSGEQPGAGVSLRVSKDNGPPRRTPLPSFTVVADQQGNFSVADVYPTSIQYGWRICPASDTSWWITGLNEPGGSTHDGCFGVYVLSGQNHFSLGVQSLADQSSAAASLVASGFADHNRNGIQDAEDTPLPVGTRLILTGPEPNANRSSYSDNNLVMHWGTVFAPAAGYAWRLCLDGSPPNDPDRFEITSVTPGGTPAGNGCWNVTIAPGENHWSIGFYDTLQPEGTPTPTMTPTPEPTEVPFGMRLVLDCDPAQDGVQASCALTLGETAAVDVDVLLINDSAGDQLMVAIGAVVSADSSRLSAPQFPAAGVLDNPDPNPEFLAAGLDCTDNQITRYGEALLGCYSGGATVPIAASSTTKIGTIHYVVPDGASPGAAALAFETGDFSDSTFDDRLCPGGGNHHVFSACSGATITLLAPATITPTPTATTAARSTATPTSSEQSGGGPNGITGITIPIDTGGSSQTLALAQDGVAGPGTGPATGVLGASIRPPNAGNGPAGSGTAAHAAGGTWFGLALLLASAGAAGIAATLRRT